FVRWRDWRPWCVRFPLGRKATWACLAAAAAAASAAASDPAALARPAVWAAAAASVSAVPAAAWAGPPDTAPARWAEPPVAGSRAAASRGEVAGAREARAPAPMGTAVRRAEPFSPPPTPAARLLPITAVL